MRFFPFLILIWAQQSAFGQLVTGFVGDARTRQPLVGVSVVVKNTARGTVTDSLGRFRLEANTGDWLVLSHVGYFMREVAAKDGLEIWLEESATLLSELTVTFQRVQYPMATTELSRSALSRQNLGQDLPVLLNFTPSAVVTSDAGAGIGYTGLRIRGSDGTRTNVTINGIPINDAESHGVFWVDMPDLVTSASSITLQRGVGTSVNGAGAFGATLNIQTDNHQPQPSAEYAITYGSFNTWRHSLTAHSGTLKDKFSLYARLSKIKSDGYIDNAWSDLKSFFISAQYKTTLGTLTANIFSGKEITFQAWNGVSEDNIRSGRRTFNELARYANETDNYQQDHYQLLHKYQFGRWKFSSGLHYTYGRGYFEQFREKDLLSDYGLQAVTIGGDTITNTDLIRRRWLDNHFYGIVSSATYTSASQTEFGSRLEWIIGGGANNYLGRHFGQVIWAQYMSNGFIGHRYYDNDATKRDANIYSKITWQFIPRYFAYLDLQYRGIGYDFTGKTTDGFGKVGNAPASDALLFFNPKAGLTYRYRQGEIFASCAVAHKEPNRDDYTNSSAVARPRPERLTDYELGLHHSFGSWAIAVGLYWMAYRDQLILTGRINDVGAYTRQNIPNSFRRGIELQSKWKITKKISWEANLAFSQNKILNYSEFIDDYDQGKQIENRLGMTDIALSPSVVAASQFRYQPFRGLEISLLSKHVGEQYLDNTSSAQRKIAAFTVHDLRLNAHLPVKGWEKMECNLLINNLLDEMYAPSGYTYGWIEGGTRRQFNYFYPQAGRHFLLGLVIGF